MPLYADIVLPVPLNQLFTYLVPESLEQMAVPGARAFVPFGKGRTLAGIIVRRHTQKPDVTNVKEILSFPDSGGPTLLPLQLKFMKWMAEYYICPPGDVMKAAIPVGLRPDSSANSKPFKPKIEVFVKPGKKLPIDLAQDISGLFRKSATAQKKVLERYLTLSNYYDNPTMPTPVSRKALADACKSAGVLHSLQENGLIELYELEIGRLPEFEGECQKPPQLSGSQQRALEQIKETLQQKAVCLLHGVTSSGKTELYIHLIKEQISRGRQVLYLLPEIALTTQIMHRLQRVFGGDMCVYHSRLSDNIRVEIWNKLTGPNPYKLILGARSAVMLPLQNLSLVIVDEEHEPSYKQEDPSPRYQGRNSAIMLAALSGAKTVLGSATPAIESYSNALSGKYGLVTLSERYGNVQLPEIEIIDTADLRRRKYMKGLFSPHLTEAINSSLAGGRQSILFHNRRGYAGKVECPDCGWVQKCDCCDVTLTFHKNTDSSVCHYCGRIYKVPPQCPDCGSKGLRGRGFGTERIEEEVSRLFPKARVARLDIDSAKSGYDAIITDFQEGRTDILIGTQMISKGLDFGNVSVVGILQADSIMSYPDFRATERAFQLMAQVSGRAGRRNERGRVIIQTRQPNVPILDMVRRNDYCGFYNIQMDERYAFNYPPYTRIVALTGKSVSEEAVNQGMSALAEVLRELFGTPAVLGPDSPPVQRVQYLYIRRLIVKAGLNMSSAQIHDLISEAVQRASSTGLTGKVTLSFDVDPQ